MSRVSNLEAANLAYGGHQAVLKLRLEGMSFIICVEITPPFLESPKEIDMVDNGGRTALHWACTSAQVDIVKDLLDMNAQVNIKDNCGWTPLHSAASVGHDEIILLLLEKGL